MSLLDNVLVFGKDVLASNETQFNVLDLGKDGRDLAGNRHGAGYLNVHVNSNIVEDAITLVMYDGDTAENVNNVIGVDVFLSYKNAGEQFSIRLPRTLKRFVTVRVDNRSAGKIDAFIGAPLADH